jgi:hypothetical protein
MNSREKKKKKKKKKEVLNERTIGARSIVYYILILKEYFARAIFSKT